MNPTPRQTTLVLQAPIDAITWPDALARIEHWAAQRQSRSVCICNAHSVVTATQDPGLPTWCARPTWPRPTVRRWLARSFRADITPMRRLQRRRMTAVGANLGPPHTDSFGDGLFELRLKGAEGIGRVFFCTLAGRRVVMLHSFVKKTQKTPPKEIEIARKRMKEVKHANS